MDDLQFATYRYNDIVQKLNLMRIFPLDVMVTGVTGAGKSTTLNAFFRKPVAKVGMGVDPETMDITSYSLNSCFRIWDTPGLGDGVQNDEKHKKKMIELLQKSYSDIYGYIDLCVVIVEGSTRDMGTTNKLLNEVIVPNIQPDRILVAINQADVAMKGHHWNDTRNVPDEELLHFLDDKANSVVQRVYESTGVKIPKPVCYSAEYCWNVRALFDMIIDNMPKKRRELLLRW